MTAKCKCGAEVPVMEHKFYEGVIGQRPKRQWSYVAALYHHPLTHESYCGPACATKALAPC